MEHNYCVLCELYGGHMVIPDEPAWDSALAVVPRKEPLPVGNAPARPFQLCWSPGPSNPQQSGT